MHARRYALTIALLATALATATPASAERMGHFASAALKRAQDRAARKEFSDYQKSAPPGALRLPSSSSGSEGRWLGALSMTAAVSNLAAFASTKDPLHLWAAGTFATIGRLGFSFASHELRAGRTQDLHRMIAKGHVPTAAQVQRWKDAGVLYKDFKPKTADE